MKEIPYNLYIHFEKLNALFIESTNREENILRCGLASVELSAYLIGSTLRLTKNTNSDKITKILQGIETQFRLLSSFNFSAKANGYKERHSQSIDHLKLLSQDYSNEIDNITRLYFKVSEKINVGFDNQVNELRSHFSLPKIPVVNGVNSTTKEMPNILKSLKLNELTYFNSEDELFMITHQISECWFNIVIIELKCIDKLFQNSKSNSDKIKAHFNHAYEVIIYLADHILLLEHMVLSNYHPLRVALRGASGGQSHQAYELFSIAKEIFKRFLSIIKSDNIDLVQILENPNTHGDLLSIINHFTKLERSLKNFFFQHYILSSSIIGSQSFGSIGFDLVSLTDKFIEPVFKEIDQAKYDLTLKTNFQYGESSGALILEKEKPCPHHKQNEGISEEMIRRVINSYFETISNLDMPNWVNLFAENGYMEDPVGSRPYVGHQQLAIFFKGVVRFFSQISMTIAHTQVEKEYSKVQWKALATSYNGKEITFNGEEVFQISDNGKILVAQVHWNPSVIADQL